MKITTVQEWSLDGVLDELSRIDHSMRDRQFAFILGAGASFTSRIPTGKDLAERWLRDLHLRECLDDAALEAWVASGSLAIAGLTWEKAAEHYPEIFERRFRGDREAGYAELENAMEGKTPSLGYSLLAEIIQNTRHKVVVTTNFDNLVADALAMHAHQSPLVVAHESLAGFVRPQLRRPLVAKIHRDLFLNPKNDQTGVSTMEEGWKIALRKLFQYFTPIVVGYGGNDGSLMGLLESLEQGDIAGRMVWCYRDGSPPPHVAHRVLTKHQGVQVKIPGFDEFMLMLAARLVTNFDVAAIADRTERLGQERAERYRQQAQQLHKSSERGTAAERKMGEVLSQSVQSGKSPWAWRIQASTEPDIDRREQMFRLALEQFPKSADLAGDYAVFLIRDRKDPDAAEVAFKRALELDPGHAGNTANYGFFLESERKNSDAAEALYKKAMELDRNHSVILGNYASFLAPADAKLLASYASLLLSHSDANSLKEVEPLVRQVVEVADDVPSQALAEALLYGSLQRELVKGDADALLARLKAVLIAGFPRGYGDFSQVFERVLPELDPARQSLYRALGAAISDEDQVGALDAFELWRKIEATNPFAPLSPP